jgi:cytochrome bd-type quinol oxidase subunit 2
MAETIRSDSDAARIIFYVAAISMAIFGAGLLLFPQVMFTLSEDPGVPANPGWVRWGGGLLLGTAVAAWLAANNPESQRPLVVGLATAFTLIALALLYSNLAGDYRGAQLLSWPQILGNAALAAAMWWLSSRPIVMTPLPKGAPQSSAKPKT